MTPVPISINFDDNGRNKGLENMAVCACSNNVALKNRGGV